MLTDKVNTACESIFRCFSLLHNTERERSTAFWATDQEDDLGVVGRRLAGKKKKKKGKNSRRERNRIGGNLAAATSLVAKDLLQVINMASASSSSSSSREKYDVFLSFRGKDTRDGFTGYLYHALDLKHIVTFKDDENLESGHRISEIMEAIKESKICIIVFSKDFASSTWCLDEVVRILECKRNGSTVVPIFYGIEPSVVRKQQEGYAEAFVKHEQDGREMVQQWKDALKEVAGISGHESNKIRPEYMFIEKIVEDVLLKLSKYVSANDHFKRHLIGIEKPTKEIEGLLCIGSRNVRIIGLYGMGGIGKTTLARAIFQTFYRHFESCCFLNDVREEIDRRGIDHLRKKLLFELFKDKTSLNTESTAIQEDRCRRTKVLIVLDDLDAISQLNRLLPIGCTFGDGSRVIVTTRDAQLLRSRADELYEVKRLNDSDALTLFRLHAFGQNSDLPGYEALSKSAADYAHCNPLALEVLGCSLRSKSIKEWKSALDNLKTDPDRSIQKVLKISYDGLGDKAKGIFLDIACFFDGEVDREYVESILRRNEQHSDATAGISDLIDKSLIIACQNKLSMHALLRQMGKAIVCNENKDPGKRSRLWNAKDVSYVLERSTGSSEVEGISLNLSELRKDVKVKPTAFSKMYYLRFLRMHCDNRFCNGEIFYEKVGWGPYDREVSQQIYLPYEGLEFPSDELRYLQWDLYPLKDFLSNFSPENLVELVMRDSQLVELHWDENQPVEKLKKMDLSYSEHLIQIPNLCGAINLESINLQGCISLVQIPLCFKNLDKLELLDLSDCENLKDGMENLPLNIRELKLCRTAIEVLPLRVRSLSGLLDLDMSGCNKLKDGIENLPSNLKELRLCGTAIQVVPSTIGCLMGLSHLDLYNCERLESLPESIWKLESLEWLDLSNCPNLIELEDCTSSSLRYLKISGCTGLRSIIALPPSLNCLDANNCTSLEKISSWWTPTVQDYDPQVQHQNNKSGGEIYNFEQCLKLDEDTCINVIADCACRRILSAHDDISYLEMVYPGDVIPRWSNYEAYGKSFMQLRPNWLNTDDSRFKFVFGAVVYAFKISGPETKIRFRFNFTTSIDSSVGGSFNYEDVCTLQVNKRSPHVLIRYATIDLRHVFGVNWSSVCRMVTGASFHVFMEEEKKDNWMIGNCALQVINFTASRDLRLWDSSASLSSSSTHQKKYDVFLSFGGDDTRNNFIGHVYHALCRKHIRIFKHDENLESGHEISEIMDAIKESEICMIVFSKDFASSTWCLDDVVRILDCRRDWEDIILPSFYGIEPSIVRKQDGSYAEAFNKHEQRFKDNMDKVQRWRDALKEVTNLSGYDSKDFGQMEDDDIVIAVLYNGTLVQNDSGDWEYRNGKNVMVSVGKRCTKSELEDEIFNSIEIDRNEYLLKLKWIYGRCAEKLDPTEIRCDRDVKCFLQEVRNGGMTMMRPPLYVEVISKVEHVCRNVHQTAFASDSGSNLHSFSCPPISGRLPQASDTEPIQATSQEIMVQETQFRDQVDVRGGAWTSFNIHEGVDVGGDYAERFPNDEEYEQLHHIDHDENYNAAGDDVGHNDIDFDHELPDNDNDMHPEMNNEGVDDVRVHRATSDHISSSNRSGSMAIFSSKFTGCESIVVGQLFRNKRDLQNKLSIYCMRENKEFKVTRSTTQRYEVVCLENTCKWRLRATTFKNGEIFVVRIFDNVHSCSLDIVHREHKQASSRVIGQCIKFKYEGIARVYKPKEIQHDFLQKYGVNISYNKAWRGKEYALNSVRGSPEENFAKLPAYCFELVSKNPGTVTRIKTDDNNNFVYFFMAIGASIRGFKSHIRFVLAVDATTLKGKYKGYMYIASGMDGNKQIYPLAFGIGDGENEQAYTWFFQNLKDAIGDFPDLVFVSDRHPAIERALRKVFPNAYHVLCTYHISRNIKANGHAKDESIIQCFMLAASAYLVEDFEFYMGQIEAKNIRAAQYIRSCDPTRWARSLCPCRRYTIMTTNIAESLNGILLDAREMPIVALIEHIRDLLQRWFYERHTAGAKLTKPVTDHMEEQLKLRNLESIGLRVKAINMHEFLVEGGSLRGTVNLQ